MIYLKVLYPVSQQYTMIFINTLIFLLSAVVMVMDNPNSYARPIKHLEKGMDFGVSKKQIF